MKKNPRHLKYSFNMKMTHRSSPAQIEVMIKLIFQDSIKKSVVYVNSSMEVSVFN